MKCKQGKFYRIHKLTEYYKLPKLNWDDLINLVNIINSHALLYKSTLKKCTQHTCPSIKRCGLTDIKKRIKRNLAYKKMATPVVGTFFKYIYGGENGGRIKIFPSLGLVTVPGFASLIRRFSNLEQAEMKYGFKRNCNVIDDTNNNNSGNDDTTGIKIKEEKEDESDITTTNNNTTGDVGVDFFSNTDKFLQQQNHNSIIKGRKVNQEKKNTKLKRSYDGSFSKENEIRKLNDDFFKVSIDGRSIKQHLQGNNSIAKDQQLTELTTGNFRCTCLPDSTLPPNTLSVPLVYKHFYNQSITDYSNYSKRDPVLQYLMSFENIVYNETNFFYFNPIKWALLGGDFDGDMKQSSWIASMASKLETLLELCERFKMYKNFLNTAYVMCENHILYAHLFEDEVFARTPFGAGLYKTTGLLYGKNTVKRLGETVLTVSMGFGSKACYDMVWKFIQDTNNKRSIYGVTSLDDPVIKAIIGSGLRGDETKLTMLKSPPMKPLTFYMDFHKYIHDFINSSSSIVNEHTMYIQLMNIFQYLEMGLFGQLYIQLTNTTINMGHVVNYIPYRCFMTDTLALYIDSILE